MWMFRVRSFLLCAIQVYASFNPYSTLTSYVDANCGPRGNNPTADLSQCSDGHEVLEEVSNENGDVAISLFGCDYFSYTIYGCKMQTSGAWKTEVVVSCPDTQSIVVSSAYMSSSCGAKQDESAYTSKVRSVCNGINPCSIGWKGGDNNVAVTDPCPGQPKTLHVDYLCEPRCRITLYENTDFGGKAVSFLPGDHQKAVGMMDLASSISVDPGCRAILYEHTSFVAGKTKVYSEGNYSSLWLHNKVSSLKVFEAYRGWWFPGQVDKDCNAACQVHGMVCKNDELYRRNSDVDSSTEVTALLDHVGAVTTASSCVNTYTSSDTPLWAPSECAISQKTRAELSFDCGQVPSPVGQSKQRLCYCRAEANVMGSSVTLAAMTDEGVSTSTAPALETIKLTVTIELLKAAEFVQEPDSIDVLREAFATLLDVPVPWIQNLQMVEQRRLRRALDITTKSGIVVTFDVIPQDDGSVDVTATILMDRFNEMALEEATVVINQVISSGVLGPKDYSVTVIAKKAAKVEPKPTEAPEEEGQTFIVVIAICCSIFSICMMLILCYAVRKKIAASKQIEAQRLMDNRLVEKALKESMASPSNAMSIAHKQNLCNLLSGMLEYSDPLVFVCFAVGQRKDDVAGCGPGLLYATGVVQALHDRAIPSYCSMPDAMDDDACLKMLGGEDTPCKLLVVLETRALYSSIKCLQQIHSAIKNDISITRLRYEETPVLKEQWSDLPANDSTWIDMRTASSHELPMRRVVPDDFGFVPDAPGCLGAFAEDLYFRYMAEQHANSTGSVAASSKDSVQSAKYDLHQSGETTASSNVYSSGSTPSSSERAASERAVSKLKSRTASGLTEKSPKSGSSVDSKKKKLQKSYTGPTRSQEVKSQPLGKLGGSKVSRDAKKRPNP